MSTQPGDMNTLRALTLHHLRRGRQPKFVRYVAIFEAYVVM